MTPQQYLDHITTDSARFAERADGSLDQRIDFLGSWHIRDLVTHLGRVYSTVIRSIDPQSPSPTDPPTDDASLRDWFAERRTTLLATFDTAGDDDPVETFAGDRTVAWWKRRLAHETAVHRWDVDAAIDGPTGATAIDSELAADGVDEYLEVGLRTSSNRPDRGYPQQSLHLHRSDGPGEWMLVGDGQGGFVVTQEHGKGDAAVRGPASALVLWIWGRPIDDDVEVFGDEAVAEAWRKFAH